MSDYTVQEKRNAEVEKLNAETRMLRHPWRNYTFWLSLATTTIALGAASYQFVRSDLDYQAIQIETRHAELNKREAETLLAETKERQLKLDADVKDLSVQKERIEEEKEELTGIVTEIATLLKNEITIGDLQNSENSILIIKDILFPIKRQFSLLNVVPGANVKESFIQVEINRIGMVIVTIKFSGMGSMKKTRELTVVITDYDGESALEEIVITPQTLHTKVSLVSNLNLDARLYFQIKESTLERVLLPSQISLF